MTTPRPDALTDESEAYMAEVYPDFLEPTKTLGVLRARLRKCLAAIERAARADAEREVVALRGLTDRLALYLSESVERPFWPAGTREAFVEFLALPKHNGADYVFARRNIRAALADAGTDCRTPGCGHPATAHDELDWDCTADGCECDEYTAPDAGAEEVGRG